MGQTQHLPQDTPITENEHPHPEDPQQVGSGSAQAPGGSQAPHYDEASLTHGETGYGAPRGASDANTPGETPEAGDIDPDSTASSEETGQDGDTDKPEKNKANPWNG